MSRSRHKLSELAPQEFQQQLVEFLGSIGWGNDDLEIECDIHIFPEVISLINEVHNTDANKSTRFIFKEKGYYEKDL